MGQNRNGDCDGAGGGRGKRVCNVAEERVQNGILTYQEPVRDGAAALAPADKLMRQKLHTMSKTAALAATAHRGGAVPVIEEVGTGTEGGCARNEQ